MINYFAKKPDASKSDALKKRVLVVAVGLAVTALIYGGIILLTTADNTTSKAIDGLSLSDKTLVYQYLVNSIDSLAPEEASSETGRFTIQDVSYMSSSTASVVYSDDLGEYTGRMTFVITADASGAKQVNIREFVLAPQEASTETVDIGVSVE